MKLDFKLFDNYCIIKYFFINGIKADQNHFGDRIQLKESVIICDYNRFTIKPVDTSILNYYSISENEYIEIAKLLETNLTSTHCGLCFD